MATSFTNHSSQTIYDWLGILSYGLKFFIYWGWCLFGIKSLELNYRYPKLMALFFATLRFALGISLILVFLLLSYLFYGIEYVPLRGVFIYLFVAIPLRWFEWSVLEFIMNKKARTLGFLIHPCSLQSRNWRLGGITINFITDLPLMFMAHSIFDVSLC
jgi:hypothetical protein